MTTAQDLIETFEGCSLRPYLCPAGYWTIGYGHLCGRFQPEISKDFAEQLLAFDTHHAEDAVLRLTRPKNLTPGQFAALTSFTFNLGAGALQASTLRHCFMRGDISGAAGQFLLWTHGGGRVLPGLVARRAAERALFLA